MGYTETHTEFRTTTGPSDLCTSIDTTGWGAGQGSWSCCQTCDRDGCVRYLHGEECRPLSCLCLNGTVTLHSPPLLYTFKEEKQCTVHWGYQGEHRTTFPNRHETQKVALWNDPLALANYSKLHPKQFVWLMMAWGWCRNTGFTGDSSAHCFYGYAQGFTKHIWDLWLILVIFLMLRSHQRRSSFSCWPPDHLCSLTRVSQNIHLSSDWHGSGRQ